MPPTTRKAPWSDHSLFESIRRVGPVLPVYRFDGQILDGARRLNACRRLGIEINEHECRSVLEAAPILWVLHPERAWEKFQARGIVGCARLFGVRPGAVASIVSRMGPPGAKVRYRRIVTRARRYHERCEQGLERVSLDGLERALRDVVEYERRKR